MKRISLSTVLACCIISLLAILGLSNPASAETFTLIVPVSATADIYNNNNASNAIDGNTKTIWLARTDPPYGDGADITFDLGQVMQIVGFQETSGPFPANPFVAYVSTDGENFTQVASGNLTQWEFGVHLFETSEDVRYIRLFLERTDATGTGELAEFRALAPAAISVNIDIKPESSPNPLNVESKGVLPVAILGTEDFDVTEVNIASIRLEGAAPIRSIIEDVSTPLLDKQDECGCASEGEDGFDDLTLKFDTQEVVSALGKVADADRLVLTLTGELSDRSPIEGKDCINTLSKRRHKPIKECLCAAQWENGIGAADIRTLGDLDLACSAFSEPDTVAAVYRTPIRYVLLAYRLSAGEFLPGTGSCDDAFLWDRGGNIESTTIEREILPGDLTACRTYLTNLGCDFGD
jgi:hypothetical protein